MCTATAVALVFSAGHLALALIATLFTFIGLRELFLRDGSGMTIRWGDGEWHYGSADHQRAAQLVACNLNFECVVYLALRPMPAGKLHGIWVFADSVSTEEYRCLRAQLTLSES